MLLSRLEAKKAGVPRYAGKVCAKHPELAGERYVASYGCITCALNAVKKNQAANPEKVSQRNAEYWAKNKHTRKAEYKIWVENNKAALVIKKRTHREKNIEALTEKYKAYYTENYPRMLAKRNKQHADKLDRTPNWLTKDDHWMIEQAYELAALRTKMLGFQWHVDHVLPLRGKLVSGLHTPYNLQVIPAKENLWKGNRVELNG